MEYVNVLELTKLAGFEFSFIKGYGENYKRINISQTPCWFYIVIADAREYIDKMLNEMTGPNGKCHSHT